MPSANATPYLPSRDYILDTDELHIKVSLKNHTTNPLVFFKIGPEHMIPKLLQKLGIARLARAYNSPFLQTTRQFCQTYAATSLTIFTRHKNVVTVDCPQESVGVLFTPQLNRFYDTTDRTDRLMNL